jgi:hypothetical protein
VTARNFWTAFRVSFRRAEVLECLLGFSVWAHWQNAAGGKFASGLCGPMDIVVHPSLFELSAGLLDRPEQFEVEAFVP